MKRILKNLSLVVAFLAMGFLFLQAQLNNEFPSEVVKATKSGNAQILSKHFFDSIELMLPGKTGVYSRNQAEMIMKDFFGKNPPTDFRIIHKGQKENASFAIGNYSSAVGSFRITFLTKNSGNRVLIHQLRIEKQDE